MRYRLLRTTTTYKLKTEDGPGSFTHILDTEKQHVLEEWAESEDTSQSEVVHETAFHVYHRYWESTTEEEEYLLECLDETSSRWKWVATLRSRPYGR